MANKKISDFTEDTAPGLDDWVETESAAGNSRKVKRRKLAAPWSFSPPTAASFTLVSGDATNLTLADDSDVGLTVNCGAPVTGEKIRGAIRTLTTKASDWDLKVKINLAMPNTQYSMFGILLYDSVAGKCHVFGIDETGGIHVANVGNLTTWSSNPLASTPIARTENWLRVQHTGGNYVFSISIDGKNWSTVYTVGDTSYLTSRADKVGIAVDYSRTTGLTLLASVPYFSLTGAAV